MKTRRAIFWTVGGGISLCAAAFWLTGLGTTLNSNSDPAWAQTTGQVLSETSHPVQMQAEPAAASDNSSTGSDSTNPNPPPRSPMAGTRFGGPWANRQSLLRDFLRWEQLTPDQRRQERQLESENESEEWTRFIEFLRNNSHNRYMMVIRLAPRQGSMVRNRLMQVWLTIEQEERTNPSLFDVHVQQFRVEDTVFGLAAELRRARRAGNSSAMNEIEGKIHDQAGKLVDLDFAERDIRIQNAQRLLDQQKSLLAKDQERKDSLTDQRTQRLLAQFNLVFSRPTPSDVSASPTTEPAN